MGPVLEQDRSLRILVCCTRLLSVQISAQFTSNLGHTLLLDLNAVLADQDHFGLKVEIIGPEIGIATRGRVRYCV
jgi:hypothetical protein